MSCGCLFEDFQFFLSHVQNILEAWAPSPHGRAHGADCQQRLAEAFQRHFKARRDRMPDFSLRSACYQAAHKLAFRTNDDVFPFELSC